jgi:hypothetical protein
VITLSGAIIAYATQGLPYIDAGASWTDNRDGSGSTLDSTFTLTGSVDTTTIGPYTIDYNKRDAAGNMATPVSRVVVVRAPVNIILTGSLVNTGVVVIPASGNTGLIASGTLVIINNNTVSTSSSSGTLSISGNTTITPTSTWDGQIIAPNPATGTGILQLSENGVLPNLPSPTVMTGFINTALMTIQA